MGMGNAGAVKITVTEAITLDSSRIFSDVEAEGNAGKIIVNATDQVIVDSIDATLNDPTYLISLLD